METTIPEPDNDFSRPVLAWFDRHGRTQLPWQHNRSPYRVWVSEIMLQQTQVETVIPYYQRFITRFADIDTLANADSGEVMACWAGLGYYARARNLHRAAQQIRDRHDGLFPLSFDDVIALPGIGRSTAGSILALADDQRHPILDGNVKRVLSRCFGVFGHPGKASTRNRLWQIAERLTPAARVADYTQAIMDLGATVCVRSRPDCRICPLQRRCIAFSRNLQDKLPEPAPAKIRPLRKARMLLIHDQQAGYLLIRRPPSGIWGGLWSLPQITDSEVDHRKWCRDELGLEVDSGSELSRVNHAFTHFELNITPIICTLIAKTDTVLDETGALWYTPATDTEPGIPSAVSKIFRLLQSLPP